MAVPIIGSTGAVSSPEPKRVKKKKKKSFYIKFFHPPELRTRWGVNLLGKKNKHPPKRSEFNSWNTSQGVTVITTNYFPLEQQFLNISFFFFLPGVLVGKSGHATPTATFLHARKIRCCGAVLAPRALRAWWNRASWTPTPQPGVWPSCFGDPI